jgi:hypothetical protein
MSYDRIDGPDFICVGMPKAGTGWLFDQLQFHPDFWMSPLKGLHYLDRDTPAMKNAIRKLQRMEKRPDRPRPTRRPGDERDLSFLREAVSLKGMPRDLHRYASLFRYKGPLLSGDITAPYAGLQEDAIAEVAAILPQVKIIFLVRDPVARVWSNVSMAYRAGRFDRNLLSDVDGFRSFLISSPMYEFSFATTIAERWARSAPKVSFQHFFFDDIDKDPKKARAEILEYLGADPAKESGQIPAGHNRKATAEKLVLTDPVRTFLVDHFKDELRGCAARFDGHAREWLARYGL